MNTSKIIRAVVGGGRYTTTAPLMKEDYGIYLKIEGVELPETYEIDFSNDRNSGTSVTMIGNSDGVLIPSQFIKTGRDIFAFYYHVGKDYGRTTYTFCIPNRVRPDRTEETPEPEQQSVIDQAISALNTAVAGAEQSASSASESADFLRNASASATTLSSGSDASVTLTDGEFSFGIPRGDKGDKGETGAKGNPGEDGYSPTVSITPITGGHRITITDKDGSHSADVMDGTGSVDDVQINGTSIVTDGVANVPIASISNLGVVKTDDGFGVRAAGNGVLTTNPATLTDIKQGTNYYKPIASGSAYSTAFYGLAKAAGDTTQASSSNPVGTYTDDAKTAIRTMLGLEDVYQDYSSALTALGVI